MNGTDWRMEPERFAAVEQHLARCFEELEDAQEMVGEGYDVGVVAQYASAPFCGCVTCIVREVLWAAFFEHAMLVEDKKPELN